MTIHATHEGFTAEQAIAVADRMNVDLEAEGIAVRGDRRRTDAATDEIELSHIWLRFDHRFGEAQERIVMLPGSSRGGE